MSHEPEPIYDPDPMLNASDAFYMGQLHALGLAMPSDIILRTAARQVTEEEIMSDLVQTQMDRMVKIAETIDEHKIGIFGGLAFNQMRLNDQLDVPLDIMLVPTPAPNAPVEVQAKYGAFQLLVNASFRLPPRGSKLWIDQKIGCFSSGITSVVKSHAEEAYSLKALSRFGEGVRLPIVQDFAAISLQHERDHLRRRRAADSKKHLLRNLVSRNQLEDYRTYIAAEAHRWPTRQTRIGWEKTRRDPEYLLPTTELEDAFETGRADINDRGLAIAA